MHQSVQVILKSPFYLKSICRGGLSTGGFGKEARDDVSSFALSQRQLALHSVLVLVSRLRTLVAPLGAEAT